MKDDERNLPDGERRAIDEIRQQLDREFAGVQADASSDPGDTASGGELKGARPWLRTALAVGAGTAVLAALVAVTFVASKLLAPDPDVFLRDRSRAASPDLPTAARP